MEEHDDDADGGGDDHDGHDNEETLAENGDHDRDDGG